MLQINAARIQEYEVRVKVTNTTIRLINKVGVRVKVRVGVRVAPHMSCCKLTLHGYKDTRLGLTLGLRLG